MKLTVFIVCLAAFGLCKARAQGPVSSKRNVPMQEAAPEATKPADTTQIPVSAILISGDRQAKIKEVPLEKETRNTAVTPVVISSLKKPE